MAVEIRKNGWVVRGDSKEDLAMGIAAVEEALSRAEQPARRGRPRGKAVKTETQDQRKRREQYERVLTFLKTIAGSQDGTTTGPLLKALGIKRPTELGSPVNRMNRILEGLSIEPSTVYRAKRRGNDSGKTWYSGPRMREAIQAIEEELKSQ